jgi:acyl transferase domain-containing protein
VSTDVAIIGLACRFPNGDSPDEVWQSLVDGKDAIGEIPKSRWDTSKVQASKYGALLPRLDAFDSLFFEIAPREAKLMDPQQRLMLETVWETLEHAGYAGAKLFGGDVGIFVGSTNTDYFERIKPVLTSDDYAAGLGNKTCIIPNRVSYFMNWRGPSVLVDTACSSSLVALHHAVESLRRGECSYAVAGGVNVLLSPIYYNALHRMGVQAPDGRCKAFDHRANGFATGEGAGALLLKPLDRAIADGDTIYAVIKGSAVNHDGKSAGLAAPNPAAHADVIASAYRRAGISPETVSYIEAHGTGTTLGDVIELHGLTEAFRRFTDKKRFCALGSIKTNIGHLEPAAGIAGVIKVVLSMMNKTLPASLHVEQENPKIAWDETPFRVVAKTAAWTCDGPRRAGVSSFGMGGANAHVVLEEAPPREIAACRSREAFVVPLSARSDASLRELAGRFQAYIAARPALRLADVAFTTQTGRSHFKHRVAIVARDTRELADALARIASAPTLEAANGGAIHVGVVKMRSRSEAFAPPASTARRDAEEIALRYARGEEIAFAAAWSGDAPARIALPTYAFEKQSHWIDFPELVPRQGPSCLDPASTRGPVLAAQPARASIPPSNPAPSRPPAPPSAKPSVHPFLAKRHS